MGWSWLSDRKEFIVPELPDVEVFRRYFDSTGLHKKIKRVQVHNNKILDGVSKKRLEGGLKNKSFSSTLRHGKHLFVQVNGDGWLVLHFGMTGRLKYFKNKKEDPEHDRMRVSFANGYHLAFDNQRLLGRIRLINKPQDFIEDKKLGPDALDLEAGEFKRLLKKGRGAVKSTLMNQKIIAGIGNIYSDEILFHSRIHPRTEVTRLTEKELEILFGNTGKVLQTAIDCQVEPDRFPRSYLLPHREEKARCPNCGGHVKKIKVSGRTAYFCPKCQKKK
jgi:formamidopyrimidine-DNA glycosylase